MTQKTGREGGDQLLDIIQFNLKETLLTSPFFQLDGTQIKQF